MEIRNGDYMRGVFRHYSTILLMIGIMVSFIAFMNGTDIYRQIKYAQAEVNDYQYRYTYTLSISKIKNLDEILDAVSEFEANVTLTSYSAYLDADSGYHITDILLKKADDFIYPVDIIDENGSVIIGKGLQDLCYEDDGKTFIKVNGGQRLVKGITSARKSSLLDYKLIIESDAQDIRNYIHEGQGLEFECASTDLKLSEDILRFYEKYHDKCDILYSKINEKYVDVGSEYSDEQFYMLIALFAVINCVSLSEFWIMRRRKEIVIRKLCGFSNARLFRLLYGQMLAICGCAVVAAFVVQVAATFINGDYIQVSPARIATAVVFLIVMALLIVALPIYKAAHYRIDKGVL